MLYDTGRQSRNAGSFLRKELGEALRIGPNFFPRLNAPILRRLTATPAGRALRCSLNVQAMLTQEPGSEILCRISEPGSCSSSWSTGDTKASSVTLTIYSSPPQAAIPQPSARRAVKPKNLKNLRAEGPSTLTPQACPQGLATFLSDPLLYRTIHSILSVLNREINKHHRCSHESCQRCELGAFEAQGQCTVVSPEVFQEET